MQEKKREYECVASATQAWAQPTEVPGMMPIAFNRLWVWPYLSTFQLCGSLKFKPGSGSEFI